MFKAFDTVAQSNIVILDAAPARYLELREHGRAHRLHCPTCHHPVGVRTPQQKRPHFFHMHLGVCPSSRDSPELLEARAALYGWLQARFPDQVTIEKHVSGADLPRPVDCWVETTAGLQFAYWIFDRGMRPESRAALRQALSSNANAAHYLFFSSRIQRNDAPNNRLNLTTTEREFIQASAFDRLYRPHGNGGDGSLHYFDSEKQAVTTFRSLVCIEVPQRYEGTELATSGGALVFTTETGEPAHAGERERLKTFDESERRRQAREAERRKAAEEEQRCEERRQAAQKPRPLVSAVQPPAPTYVWPRETPLAPAHHIAPPSPTPQSPRSGDQEGVCVACGTRTRDWWSFDGKTHECKCNSCLRAGRFP